MNELKEDVWNCPKCLYIITNTEMQSARYNYPCFGCKKLIDDGKQFHLYYLSDYRLVKKIYN